MAKRLSINELRKMLAYFKETCKQASDPVTLAVCKQRVRSLQARIANREKYDAMRSLGMKKTPYGWE